MSNSGDCDDRDPMQYTSAACTGADACTGFMNDSCTCTCDDSTCVKLSYYKDSDGDGYGNPGDIIQA